MTVIVKLQAPKCTRCFMDDILEVDDLQRYENRQ